jgi:hypothetical protein
MFLDFRERIRDQLEAWRLPSDRTPGWIREAGGEWRPETEADKERLFEPDFQCDWANWSAVINDVTEPLSRGRAAADLL